MDIPDFKNISDSVFHHAARQPDAPALICGCETLSYSALARLVAQASVFVADCNIKLGDFAGVCMTNSLEHVVLSLALLRVGAVPVELSADLDRAGLDELIARYKLGFMFTDTGMPVFAVAPTVQIGMNWRRDLATLEGDRRTEAEGDALRMIILSSGSTGIQKAIIMTQAQRLERLRVHFATSPAERLDKTAPVLMLAPATTEMIMYLLYAQLVLGGISVLLPLYRKFFELARECAAWPRAICAMPPDLAGLMLSFAGKDGLVFDQMSMLIVAGQPMTSQRKTEIRNHVSPHLYEAYGAAGFGIVTMLLQDNMAGHPSSVGQVITYPGVDIEVVDPDGQRLPVGESGELRMRGPGMATGFYLPAENQRGTERFAGGWYYPGDVGKLDPEGYLTLVGRLADAIKLGKLTIYPAEIENIIDLHPDVREVALVSRPVPGGKIELCAFIVPGLGANRHAIATHCRKQLPVAKQPRYLIYLDRMPVTPGNKLDRPGLRTMNIILPDPL
jgi:acyl-CoA synthetase (AMP-forming)/AMP-acid ligase II